MKFKAKSLPKYGDTRTRTRFAFLPTKVGCYWVWLERYFIYEEYSRVSDYPLWSYKYFWEEISRASRKEDL